MRSHLVLLRPLLTAKQYEAIADPSLRIPTGDAIPITFRALAKLFATPFILDTDGTDYRAFSALVKARGRFTHPKRATDIHPFAALATMNWGLEWLLHSWRDLIVACAKQVEGVSKEQPSSLPRQRPRFEDHRLVDFNMAEKELIDAHKDDGFGEVLLAILSGLREDTDRSLAIVRVKNTEAEAEDVPLDLAVRNLVRIFFTEIEGSTFFAAWSLHRLGFTKDSPKRDFLNGPHEEVRERIGETLDAFSRHLGNKLELSRNGEGWDGLCGVRALRNRMVHPQDPSAHIVAPKEYGQLLITLSWWQAEARKTLEAGRAEALRQLPFGLGEKPQ